MLASKVGLCLLIVFTGQSLTVTPVEKVVKLLKNLRERLEGEAKAEAAQYDKFACFCKEQADDKLYAIEKSNKTLASLDAEIEKLDADIASLNSDISGLATTISELRSNISDAEDVRDGEHKIYKKVKKNVTDAIEAVNGAIAALKDSKKQLKGKSAKEALAQIKAIETQYSQFIQPGTSYSYTYSSNDIIATLESLRKIFIENRNEIDQEEFEVNAAFEKRRLGLQNEKKFAEQEKSEKEAEEASKQEQLADAKANREQELKERTADEEFLQVLTADCEEKANLWDQRSSTRANEITEMTKAMESLETGVVPNWNANKKLSGIQKSSGHWVWVEQHPASFLQLHRSQRRSTVSNAAEKAIQSLAAAAGRLNSHVLSVVALKMRSKIEPGEDHFVKVRTLIKDIIQTLKAQANDEAGTKSFCDKEMKAAIDERDKADASVEELMGSISAKEASMAKLKRQIEDLQQGIADNEKALLEATTLRDSERGSNEKIIADAAAGHEAVVFALSVLKNFYESQGNFIQKKNTYVPPNSDREGNTVEDLRPDIFANEYKGAQDASKGIIGILEVIVSDFERTETTVTGEEEQAQGEYDLFKTKIEGDSKAKSSSVTTKEGQVSQHEDDLVTLRDNLKTAKEDHSNALAELDKLHSMCVAGHGEDAYKERVEKREKEIEALKEAYAILDSWQS